VSGRYSRRFFEDNYYKVGRIKLCEICTYVEVVKTSTDFGFVKNEGGAYGYEVGMLRDLKSWGRVGWICAGKDRWRG